MMIYEISLLQEHEMIFVWNYGPFIGLIQTLSLERVKSQSIGNRTLNSESASKIMPTCEI